MKTLYKNGIFVTAVNDQEIVDGHMIVNDGLIVAVQSGGADEQNESFDHIVDLRGKWVMPGWINTHSHAAMTLLRGLADDYPLKEWLEQKIWPVEAHFDAHIVRQGTALAVLEMLKSGTTCFADMYDHMHAVAEIVDQSGMRGVLSRGIIGFGSEAEQQAKLEEAVDFAKTWHKQASGRITTMLAPHAPYTCSPEYIGRIVDQAAQINVPIHIHMSETKQEVDTNVQQYGKRPVQHLLDIGVFEQRTLVAHAVHIEEAEMNILLEHDVKIAHNPASNLKLGSGVAKVPQLIDKGFHVSIGTDGAASNNNLDMFQEVRLAALMHKGTSFDPTAVPAATALSMGTKWGAESLFLPQIGTLESGREADFITLNPEQPHLKPAHAPLSHIIYSASGQDVVDVYVQGRCLVQDRQCVYLDEERIMYEAERALARVL